MIHPVKEKQPLTKLYFCISLSVSHTHVHAHTLQNVKFDAFEFITFLQLAHSWHPQSNLSNVSFDALILEKF
jgi:hypothetical protein